MKAGESFACLSSGRSDLIKSEFSLLDVLSFYGFAVCSDNF